jgi:thiamine biosynthesis lipoprotein
MRAAGLDSWPEVAHAMGLDKVAVVDEAGTVYLTSAMEQRIHFTGEIEKIVVSLTKEH